MKATMHNKQRRMDMTSARNLALSNVDSSLKAMGMLIAYARGSRTQAEIAATVGVTPATVSNFENGARVRPENAVAILKAIGIGNPKLVFQTRQALQRFLAEG